MSTKQERHRALVESLHGTPPETVECLGAIRVSKYSPRTPDFGIEYDDDFNEPGWRGPSYSFPAAAMFPWIER
jgi:hypothetical protein